MKAITEITLYEIMGQDMEVWVKRNKQFGFDLEIDNEEGGALVKEEGIHPYAADSLADFCRSFLASYDKASGRGQV